jgi:hypothetical protein
LVSGVFPRTATSNEEGPAAGVDLLTRVSDDDRRGVAGDATTSSS